MDSKQQWLDALKTSLTDGSFIALQLRGYKGREPELKQLLARKILVKREEKLSITYRYKTRDIVKNHALADSVAHLAEWLAQGFSNATLFTTGADITLNHDRIDRAAPTRKSPESLAHDRAKHRHVSTENKPYLHALGITDAQGRIYKNAQDKYRQIDKYIEIVAGLLPPTGIARIADMGSGKGYLTFALYDYLTATLGRTVEMVGVEYRADLVSLCNQIASDAGFTGLRFQQGSIADFDSTGIDMLIALHACDTATDDAIARGIHAGAKLMVVAPCCHKQIRREMETGKPNPELALLTRHGTFMEREAEMVTDAMRAQLLEYCGYDTKLFEFISDAHTPKNVMITATLRTPAKPRDPALLAPFTAAKHFFGIGRHQLEQLLNL